MAPDGAAQPARAGGAAGRTVSIKLTPRRSRGEEQEKTGELPAARHVERGRAVRDRRLAAGLGMCLDRVRHRRARAPPDAALLPPQVVRRRLCPVPVRRPRPAAAALLPGPALGPGVAALRRERVGEGLAEGGAASGPVAGERPADQGRAALGARPVHLPLPRADLRRRRVVHWPRHELPLLPRRCDSSPPAAPRCDDSAPHAQRTAAARCRTIWSRSRCRTTPG